MALSRRKRLQHARHVEQPRVHSDEAVLGNAHKDERRVSDFDPRQRYDGDPGEPIRDPNRKMPLGI